MRVEIRILDEAGKVLFVTSQPASYRAVQGRLMIREQTGDEVLFLDGFDFRPHFWVHDRVTGRTEESEFR